MSTEKIRKSGPLHGEVEVPGDKSISHRSIMLGALAEGETRAEHFLMSADCLSTISCFRQLGITVDVDSEHDAVTIHGKGLHGFTAPSEMLYTGNSGTTTRILSGILAGQPFTSTISGDESIQTRPMKRIMTPLRRMGALVTSLRGNDCTPLSIIGGHLCGIDYISPVASAQVKSCVLLAGLYADGETSVTEPSLSRNHTELMLNGFGGSVRSEQVSAAGQWKATIQPDPTLHGQKVIVPGDISSAAYFIAAALIVPGSEVLIKNVGINPTRAGLLKVVRDMGAEITIAAEYDRGGEKAADLLVRSSSLHGTEIGGAIIPTLIDEIPVIAVLAAYASGTTVIRDAAELKVKESDRIATVTETLTAMGADIIPTGDGMIIHGGKPLHAASIDSHKDHRIAMSLAVAALGAENTQGADSGTQIKDAGCVLISYPDFYEDLMRLGR